MNESTNQRGCWASDGTTTTTARVLQTPNEVLPPPPSAVVDTEHWERAMFRDRQERLDRTGGRVALWPGDKLTAWVSMKRKS